LHDVSRALDTARDRREHHLECAMTTPIQLFQVGADAVHAHRGPIGSESFSTRSAHAPRGPAIRQGGSRSHTHVGYVRTGCSAWRCETSPMRLVGFMKRLCRRGRAATSPALSLERAEEEAEIAKAQERAERENNRFAESLIEKAAHAKNPFLKDPFE